MTKLVFIGCGLTAAAVRFYLHRLLLVSQYQGPALNCIGIESEKEIGGRLLSVQNDASCTSCNLGLQYLTIHKSKLDDDVLNILEEEGVIRSFDAKSKLIVGVRKDQESLPHYFVRPSQNLVKTLFNKEKSTNHLETEFMISSKASRLDLIDESFVVSGQRKTSLENNLEDFSQSADIVVITTPSRNAFTMEVLQNGNLHLEHYPIFSEEPNAEESVPITRDMVLQAMQEVTYSSRFALALFYNFASNTELAQAINSLSYTASYINDDEIIKYIAIDKSETGVGILVHTSVPYAIKKLQESSRDNDLSESERSSVIDDCLTNLDRIIPGIGAASPDEKYLQTWRVSQVSKRIPLPPNIVGIKSVVKSKISEHDPNMPLNPRVFFAGDYFTESNFQGCLKSAKFTALEIFKTLVPKK